MKRSSLLALSLLAALPLAANAQQTSGLNYNYVEGGYTATNLDNDNGDIDADGFGGNASFALTDNFHVFGGYTGQKTDTERWATGVRVDTDIDQWRAGLGYNLPLGTSQSTDLVARLAYEHAKVDQSVRLPDGTRGHNDASDDGYSAEVGVRTAFTQNIEGHAFAGYEDFGDGADDFYGRVGAQVKFNPNWGISGDVKFADGDTQWFVGPRYSW